MKRTISTPFVQSMKARVHSLSCIARSNMFNLLEEKMANFEKVVRDSRLELAAANQREESLNETISSFHAQDERSSSSIRCSDFHVLTCFWSIRRRDSEPREGRAWPPSRAHHSRSKRRKSERVYQFSSCAGRKIEYVQQYSGFCY